MNTEAPPHIRPRWVSRLLVLCLIMSALGVILQLVYPDNPTFVRYFGDFSWAELAISCGLFALLLGAAILLRRSRREASWLVTAVFVLAGVSVVRRLLVRDIGGLVDNFGLVGLVLLVFWTGMVFVLSGVILTYVWGLNRRGTIS